MTKAKRKIEYIKFMTVLKKEAKDKFWVAYEKNNSELCNLYQWKLKCIDLLIKGA